MCDKCIDPRRVLKDDISVMYQFFAPAVGHMSVEILLRLRGNGLHLLLQVRVVFGLIACGIVSVLISMPPISGV